MQRRRESLERLFETLVPIGAGESPNYVAAAVDQHHGWHGAYFERCPGRRLLVVEEDRVANALFLDRLAHLLERVWAFIDREADDARSIASIGTSELMKT